MREPHLFNVVVLNRRGCWGRQNPLPELGIELKSPGPMPGKVSLPPPQIFYEEKFLMTRHCYGDSERRRPADQPTAVPTHQNFTL